MGREGRKVGSLKRRVRSHVAREEMKNCTLLWCKAHVQFKMYKTHQVRTTFGSWDVENWHAAGVVRSTFQLSTFQLKMYKTHHVRTTFGSSDVEKWHAPVAQTIVFTTHHVRTTFRSSDVEKMARCCGAKRIFNSKCLKHNMFGPLWKIHRKMARRCGAKHICKSKC